MTVESKFDTRHDKGLELTCFLESCEDKESFLQGIEARLFLARQLARQWFGLFLRPNTPADEWLLQGLCGWLEAQYVKAFMGRNELLYR